MHYFGNIQSSNGNCNYNDNNMVLSSNVNGGREREAYFGAEGRYLACSWSTEDSAEVQMYPNIRN